MGKVARRLAQALGIVLALLVLLLAVAVVEASGGHDGWLCEWGYDKDGSGTGTTGCG